MKYFDLINESNLFKTKFIVYEIIKKMKQNHNSLRHNDRATNFYAISGKGYVKKY